ncbi:PEGA domain-containing protein [Polyangium sorediatum]|uniref:PEGA domain-containing protein n=1 Tax=Polyangium sorediatum TaxID=889274 RepID=A0ABT6P1Y3_9BACT|nr:PEGA domain-containing protein [Polyangium sorediatum]MDI1434559.1 PEGA domain-containing protein [Polyangium sorediatum]
MKVPWGIPLGAALALGAPAARAKEPSKPEVLLAKEMVRDAVVEAKAGRCNDAIPMLEQAIAIHETGEALLALGDCQATMGKLRMAVATWKHGEEIAEAQKDKARREAIEKKRKEIEPRIPTIRLKVPAGVTGVVVTIDGEALPETSLRAPVPVDPGAHQIEAKAPGYDPFSKKVEAEDEAKLTVEITFPGLPTSGASASTGSVVPLGTWIAGGAAVAFLGGGVAAYLLAGAHAEAGAIECQKRVQCGGDRIDSVRTFDGLALGAWIGAGLAAGAAVGIWALAPKKAKDEASARIVVGPGTVSLVGRF